MKTFELSVDFTMSKRIAVEAESEEQAKAILNGWVKYNPYEYAHGFDAYVKHEITDVNEEEEEEDEECYAPEETHEALDYIRENIDEEDLTIYRATVVKNLGHHMPVSVGLDDGRIIDLLEEYGEDEELPEGWWEEFGEIEDWLMWL